MTKTIIQNTNLIDTELAELVEAQSVVFEGRKIIYVGDEGSYDSDPDDRVIDGEGMYAMPGLTDMHVHLNYEQKDLQVRGANIIRRKDSYADLLGVKHAQQYLKIGVTTVRGCGGSNSLSSLRQLIEEGKIVGPRLRLALNTLVQPGNQELFGTDAMIRDAHENEPISGVDGVIHAVRKRRSDGSDHIKTTTTGGVVHGKTSDVNQVLWRDEELEAMVSEAERLGMYVAAHAHATPGIKAAIRAGIRTIEHSTILDEEAIDMMLEKKTYITNTLSAGTFIDTMSKEYKSKLPPEVVSKWEQVSAKMVESHKLAYEKGVPMLVGTDAPVGDEHAHTNYEMQLMHDLIGMSPIEVIQGATITAAEAMRMEDMIGSITKGKQADIVLLTGNPLEDLSVLNNESNFEFVFANGKNVAKNGRLIGL